MIKRISFSLILLLIFNPTLYGDTPYFKVNNRGLPFQYNIDHDSTGNITVVWDDYRYTSDAGLVYLEQGAAIFIQKIDFEGNKLGSEQRIDEKSRLSIGNTRPDIAINKNNGDITIVWQERFDRSDGSRVSKIIYSIFDKDLRKKVFQVTLNNLDSIYQGIPEALYLTNNNILISWLENDGQPQYYACILGQNGTVVKDRFKINTNTISCNRAHFDKTSTGFYFVWNSFIQFYDNLGNTITEIINCPFEDVDGSKSINKDSLLIVQRDRPFIQNLFGSYYSISKGTFSDPFRIDDDTSSSKLYSPSIDINKNGEYIIVWEDFRNGSAVYYWLTDIYGQRYDSKGRPIGCNFKINHENSEVNQSDPEVILFENHFLVSYIESKLIEYNDEFPELSKSQTYITGTSQNFYDPSPGRILGWYYLFDLVFDVGYPYPNPYTSSSQYCSVDIEFDKETLISYEIYNILGELVYTYSPKLLIEGEYSLTWNGKSNEGKLVSSGVYIWAIHLEDNTIIRKSSFIK